MFPDAPRTRATIAALLFALALSACATQAPISSAPDPIAWAGHGRIHTFHCFDGACPTGAPNANSTIVREIYTLSSNPTTKFADWVAYVVSPQTIGPSQSRNWAPDPWLDPAETLEPEDYVSANATLGTDRGHQAPLAALSGTPHWPTTNYLSNITPQMAALNQGAWERLESRERALAAAGGPVYVLTGPLYEREMPSLPEADETHRVPSGYWKVIISSDGASASGFIFDQVTPRDARYCDYAVSIAEIEHRARLQVLPQRTRATASLLAALGCANN